MQFAKLWQRLLDVERTVVESIVFDDDEGALVAHVRPRKGATRRCGRCGRRCAWEDNGEGRRRWRALDLGAIPAYLAADAPRVRCPDHGVIVAQVPWARHKARHTTAFEDQTAWLAAYCSRAAASSREGGSDELLELRPAFLSSSTMRAFELGVLRPQRLYGSRRGSLNRGQEGQGQ